MSNVNAEVRFVSSWLRLLAHSAREGSEIAPSEFIWCAEKLEAAIAPAPKRPRASWWRRWLLPRRRIA